MKKELIVEIKDRKIIFKIPGGQTLKEMPCLVVLSANGKVIEIGQEITDTQMSLLNDRQLARLLPIRSLDPFLIDNFHPELAAFTLTGLLMGILPGHGNNPLLRDTLGLQILFTEYENLPQRDQNLFDYYLSKDKLFMIIKSLSINGKQRNLGGFRIASFILTTYALLNPLILLGFFFLLENMRNSIFSRAQFLSPWLLHILILVCASLLFVMTHFLFLLACKRIFEHVIPRHVAWEMMNKTMFGNWLWRIKKEGS